MFRFDVALLALMLPVCGLAKNSDGMTAKEPGAKANEIVWRDLPDSPGTVRGTSAIQKTAQESAKEDGIPSANDRGQSRGASEIFGDGTLSLEGIDLAIVRVRYAIECDSSDYG